MSSNRLKGLIVPGGRSILLTQHTVPAHQWKDLLEHLWNSQSGQCLLIPECFAAMQNLFQLLGGEVTRRDMYTNLNGSVTNTVGLACSSAKFH